MISATSLTLQSFQEVPGVLSLTLSSRLSLHSHILQPLLTIAQHLWLVPFPLPLFPQGSARLNVTPKKKASGSQLHTHAKSSRLELVASRQRRQPPPLVQSLTPQHATTSIKGAAPGLWPRSSRCRQFPPLVAPCPSPAARLLPGCAQSDEPWRFLSRLDRVYEVDG